MERLLAVSAHCVPWPEKRAPQVNRWVGGGRTRDDGLLRAGHDPHQTNEGESHHRRKPSSALHIGSEQKWCLRVNFSGEARHAGIQRTLARLRPSGTRHPCRGDRRGGAAGAEHLKKLSGERRREPLINVASSFKSRRGGVGFLYAGAEG